MIISTLTPHNALIPWETMRSFMFVAPKYVFTAKEGASLPDNRNGLYNFARQRNEDILMIDSDMVFKPEDVDKIAEHLKTLDIVTGLCVQGLPPYKPCIYKKIGDDYEYTEPKDGLHEIDACGAAFLGISKRVLLDNPFDVIYEPIRHGEDISFCYRANKQEYKIWCDPTILVGHIRTVAYYYKSMI